jgi:transcriptional regulator with XRE-family HTH domain
MPKVRSLPPPNANRLRALRAEYRLSQLALARDVGLTHTRIWYLENGYSEPTADERRRLAAFFGCRIREIFPKKSAVA